MEIREYVTRINPRIGSGFKSEKKKKKDKTKASSPAKLGSWGAGRDEKDKDDKKGMPGSGIDAQSPMGLRLYSMRTHLAAFSRASPINQQGGFSRCWFERLFIPTHTMGTNTVQQLRTLDDPPIPYPGQRWQTRAISHHARLGWSSQALDGIEGDLFFLIFILLKYS